MPYYIYHVKHKPGSVVKQLQLASKFDDYRLAKSEIHKLRSTQSQQNSAILKMIFAESELQAEELMQEKRQEPILMEWEK